MDLKTARKAAEAAGNFWFSPRTMSYFNSHVLPTSWTRIDDNTYRFISSERDGDKPTRFTVREMTMEPFNIVSVNGFQYYGSAGEAFADILLPRLY